MERVSVRGLQRSPSPAARIIAFIELKKILSVFFSFFHAVFRPIKTVSVLR
ncbi:hypothetical protein MmTuc01_0303 [Methanosarcina mazei Tuc01]|uniref:Uncharacterized protein n=1 Tax=Methanosarcina mazei Tuc01 TaxID=1236903 RepID=M1P5S8_METMZ|nr:hypothetical protein MmTuc01_0303 [Methanosarcina mazei Tuc01]